jgi:hypothetical protein
MSRADPINLCKPIASFGKRDTSMGYAYDASLHTIAVGVYLINIFTGTRHLIGYIVIPLPYPPTVDASYQNTYEFLAVVVGALLSLALGIRNKSCCLWGDSMSSLAWAERDRVNSVIARRANIVYTLASVRADIDVTEKVHVPGKENVVFDGLTRGKTGEEVGLDPYKQCFYSESHPIHQLVAACNPHLPLYSNQEHAILSNTIVTLLNDNRMNPMFPSPQIPQD